MEINEILEQLSVFGNDRPVPRAALAEAARQKEALTPILIRALDKVYEKCVEHDEEIYDDPDYERSFYALFLLAQFQEESAFPRFVRILKMDDAGLEMMLGDAIDNMSDMLYSTYNGDLASLEEIAADNSLTPLVRWDALTAMGGLMRDGRLSREYMVRFLRECLAAIGDSEDELEFCGMVVHVIAALDLYDMVEDVREVFRQEKVGEFQWGDFCDFFDSLYQETPYIENAKIIEDTAKELEIWSCFKDKLSPKSRYDELQELLSWNVGRNDPCPCGSGKKFKKCCLPKKEQLSAEFSSHHIPKDTYPSVERRDGRPGLADFYNRDAITVDQMVYQAMREFDTLGRREPSTARSAMRKLLWKAFLKFQSICQREGFHTPEDYDQKYKLHYYCEEWLKVLCKLLESAEDKRYLEVQAVLSR